MTLHNEHVTCVNHRNMLRLPRSRPITAQATNQLEQSTGKRQILLLHLQCTFFNWVVYLSVHCTVQTNTAIFALLNMLDVAVFVLYYIFQDLYRAYTLFNYTFAQLFKPRTWRGGCCYSSHFLVIILNSELGEGAAAACSSHFLILILNCCSWHYGFCPDNVSGQISRKFR